LSRPKYSALPGLYIGRYGPQPQRHIDRIDAQCRPEGKLADPMLFGMADGAQVPVRTCAASDGAALPQATQGS
jgi:hypothetical protein